MSLKPLVILFSLAITGCQTTVADNSFTNQSAERHGYSRENLKTIMPSKLANSMELDAWSIKNKERIEFGEFFGRDAVRMTVNYDDGGHPGDWKRISDTKPHAQRIQIAEREHTHEMLDGKEYWYKFSMFVPKETGSRYHTVSLWDLKARKNGGQNSISFAMNIVKGRFMIFSETGDLVCYNANLEKQCAMNQAYTAEYHKNPVTNRWVDLVMQIRLNKGDELFRLWVDDNLIFSTTNDLSPWNDSLGFKFGPYRHHMEPNPGRPDDDTVYYADMNRGSSCAEVDDECSKKINDYSGNAVFGSFLVEQIKSSSGESHLKQTFGVLCRNKNICKF